MVECLFKQPLGFKRAELSSNEDPDGILERLDCESTQLWLIQAPNDVDINSFHGFKVALTDEPSKCKLEETGREFEVITKVNDASQKSTPNNSTVIFNVDDASKEFTPIMKSFAGHLTVLENIPIPEWDFPRFSETKKVIPEGLRQRFTLSWTDKILESSSNTEFRPVKPKEHKRSKSSKHSPIKQEDNNVSIRTISDDDCTTTRKSTSKKRRKSQILSNESSDVEVIVADTAASSPRKRKASVSVIEEVLVDDVETPRKRRKHEKSATTLKVDIKTEAKSPSRRSRKSRS